jgi:hypothetical protein
MVHWTRQVMRAAPEDRGPIVTEKPNVYRHVAKKLDPRAAVIAEAAARVAQRNPDLHVETIGQERGYLDHLMFDTLADMVLEGRPRLR